MDTKASRPAKEQWADRSDNGPRDVLTGREICQWVERCANGSRDVQMGREMGQRAERKQVGETEFLCLWSSIPSYDGTVAYVLRAFDTAMCSS